VLRRFITLGAIVVAFGVLWFGYANRAEPTDPAEIDPAVEVFVPGSDSPGVLRQAQIGVDLADGWTGVLLINGIEIPEDQLLRVPALNQVFFTPGEGKEIERLEPGDVSATAIIWRPALGETRENGRPVRWRFRVA
jgi:hypothetical protein